MDTKEQNKHSKEVQIEKKLIALLDDRYEKAQGYSHIRHAIIDTKKIITKNKSEILTQIQKGAVFFFIFFFLANGFIRTLLLLLLIGIFLYYRRKFTYKIIKAAFMSPINDRSNDKLNELFLSHGLKEDLKHREEFKIFPSDENPWIK